MTEQKLLPCPFCGGEATIFPYTDRLGIKQYRGGCFDCGETISLNNTTEEAVRRWNTRSDNTQRYKEALEFYAKKKNYNNEFDHGYKTSIDLDEGSVARDALKNNP